MIIHCNQKTLDLTTTKIMGILNCTPDSFSDGGAFSCPKTAIRQAHLMVEAGADIIDIGAESSRPNATALTATEEIARLLPVVRVLVKQLSLPISIDTYHPQTMQVMIDEGVDIINDINGLRSNSALEIIGHSKVAAVIMHLHNPIETMHQAHEHEDIISDLKHYFSERITTCGAHGIAANRLLLDPGFGFGKTETDQLSLLKNLQQLCTFASPLLVGLSRKRLIGTISQTPNAKDRIIGSVSAALWSIQQGAKIVRVHDVSATKAALRVWSALS